MKSFTGKPQGRLCKPKSLFVKLVRDFEAKGSEIFKRRYKHKRELWVTALFFTFYNQQFSGNFMVDVKRGPADDASGIDTWVYEPIKEKRLPVQVTAMTTSWTRKKRELYDTSEEPFLIYGDYFGDTVRAERKEFASILKRVMAKKSTILGSQESFLLVYVNNLVEREKHIKEAFDDALGPWEDSIKGEVWAFTHLPWVPTKARIRTLGNYRFCRIYPRPFSAFDFRLDEPND